MAEREDDFGFELRVGAILRARGAEVAHGWNYLDRVTGKPRQFDYRAKLLIEHSEVALAVECKNLALSAPLVVCGTARTREEAYSEVIISELGPSGDAWGTEFYVHRSDQQTGMYPIKAFVGKSRLAQAPRYWRVLAKISAAAVQLRIGFLV